MYQGVIVKLKDCATDASIKCYEVDQGEGYSRNSEHPVENVLVKNTPPPEPAKEALQVNLSTFVSEFDKNQLAAEEKYTGTTVKLTGYIGNISEDILGNYFVRLQPSNDEYYFGTYVQCFFEDKSTLTSLENGQQVTLVGTVASQDLGIIGVENCSVVE